jgi:hypothetical protein
LGQNIDITVLTPDEQFATIVSLLSLAEDDREEIKDWAANRRILILQSSLVAEGITEHGEQPVRATP